MGALRTWAGRGGEEGAVRTPQGKKAAVLSAGTWAVFRLGSVPLQLGGFVGSKAARWVHTGSSQRMLGRARSQPRNKHGAVVVMARGVLRPDGGMWLPDAAETSPTSRTALSGQLPREVPPLLLL